MIKLNFRGKPQNIFDAQLGTIKCGYNAGELVVVTETGVEIILTGVANQDYASGVPAVSEIAFLDHIEEGDIVAVYPTGQVMNLFRKRSPNNSLFITDRCNSNCLMCSQPPKNRDDLDHFYDINTRLVKLMPKDTQELGITGGEPTLLGRRFVHLLETVTNCLPDTEIHILTNGRAFAWKDIPASISEVNNRRMVFGVPLYSDFYLEHDYVVQAKDAFTHTMMGFHNMARYGLRAELRVVLHKQTYKRLPSLAKFIYKNLPFVEHVAFMGLEYTGYTPYNNDLLWMEPGEYTEQLEEAVLFLDAMGMNVSIYNLQFCLLKSSLWKFARNSISDWKKDYLDECKQCVFLKECGGVFATTKKQSELIKAILN